MGWVHHYNLAELVRVHNLEVFVETGIGNGDGVIEAQKYPFKKILSIEIMPLQVERMKEKFKNDPRVEVILGDTLVELPKILQSEKRNICFWLDAHFPGADIGMGRHDDSSIDDKTRLPLEEELFMIKDQRQGKDVVLFDDLKIYRNQGRDAWREDIKPRHSFSSDRFYEEILSATHNCFCDDNDTGYCQLTPKT